MNKKQLEKIACTHLNELEQLIQQDGYTTFTQRDDVEEVDYLFAKMFVRTVYHDNVTVFGGVSDVSSRYHFTVVAQGNNDDTQVVVQKNIRHN